MRHDGFYIGELTVMTLANSLKWIVGIVSAALVLPVLFLAIFGVNWLRAPVERLVMEKTGRQLVIGGDLTFTLGWPRPRIHAGAVTFANPVWATEKQMVAADAVEIAVDLPQLLLQNVVFPEVLLERPIIFLEQSASGQKNWLLDINQVDEAARIHIGRLSLDHGLLGYDAAEQKTSIRLELSTSENQTVDDGLRFTAQGKYKGLPLKAQGSGGPVLGLRDESTPYPLTIDLSVGQTGIKANGSITSLLKFSAMDMHLAVHGASLAQLFPLVACERPS